jgi:hypothetical protein
VITGERVVGILRGRGPSLPNEIRLALGEGDTFVVGAVLSELKSSGKVKISSTKKGGSPFYFLPEQERLLERLSENLNEKDKRALQLLREKKVLLDTDLDPLTRVALRSIKDFSKPVEVNKDGQTRLFFRYFLFPGNEAESLIKEKLGMKKPIVPQPEIKQETPQVQKPVSQPIIQREEVKPIQKETQESLGEVSSPEGEFDQKISRYFKRKEIEVVEKDVIRKQSEIDYVVKIPSPAGELKYYCKARNKKKLNDKDVAQAFVEGNDQKLPVLFIVTGELTKKAKEMVNTKYRSVTVVEL